MSAQGTLTVESFAFERQLLEAWGDWARGDIGLGYTVPGIWKKNGVGLMFSDDDLCQADAAVARLPKAHKRVLKRVYISRKGIGIDGNRKQAAVAAFSELLEGVIEEQGGRAAVHRNG